MEYIRFNYQFNKGQYPEREREGGDNGLFISLVPQILYIHISFLIRQFNNFVDFNDF